MLQSRDYICTEDKGGTFFAARGGVVWDYTYRGGQTRVVERGLFEAAYPGDPVLTPPHLRRTMWKKRVEDAAALRKVRRGNSGRNFTYYRGGAFYARFIRRAFARERSY